jgi:hypothetical protein
VSKSRTENHNYSESGFSSSMKDTSDFESDEEFKTYEKASVLFGKLLDDLKTRNMLRKTTQEEKRRLLSILWNTLQFQDAFNEMTKRYDPRNFDDFVTRTGLTKETLVFSFVNQILGNLLTCYESLIKLSLLFFVDEKSGLRKYMTLGQLLIELKKISPLFVAQLSPMINRELRNALAHGFFWLESDGLHFAKNSYLEGEKTISFNELGNEMRKTSIIGRAFVHVMREKATIDGL